MEAKVHIRIDQLEVDCAGSEDFLRQELPKILDAIAKFRENSGDSSPKKGTKAAEDGQSSLSQSLTTKTVAAKLKSRTGSDLIFASAAKLSIADGQTVSRGMM